MSIFFFFEQVILKSKYFWAMHAFAIASHISAMAALLPRYNITSFVIWIHQEFLNLINLSRKGKPNTTSYKFFRLSEWVSECYVDKSKISVGGSRITRSRRRHHQVRLIFVWIHLASLSLCLNAGICRQHIHTLTQWCSVYRLNSILKDL